MGEYAYNGDGQRIKKVVPSTGETTIFVYDASNKLVAEYSTVVEPPATAKTSYLTNDHLGSPRITTDALGQVISRRDFMPFGEEIPRAGYGADSVRQKFTGYERDNEINLDFAQARYYNNQHARFTTMDPLLTSAKSGNPQTWNRFIYVINNPIRYTDPTGLCPEPSVKPGQVGICVEAFIKAKRIDTVGHGDNRDHTPSDPTKSARMRTTFIVDARETSITVQEKTIARSEASIPVAGAISTAGGPVIPVEGAVPLGSAQGTGTIDVSGEGTNNPETGDFGTTTISVEMRNGANGFQAVGTDLKENGAFVARQAGKVIQAVAPGGTIDVSAQIQITGRGDNIAVTGSALSRPYPSVTGYAYIGMSNGTVRTVELFRQDEAHPRDLTKPMRRIK